MLPVTVRGVEPALQGRNLAIGGESLRVTGSDGQVAEWLRTVAHADDYASHEIKHGKDATTINDTGSASILSGQGNPVTFGLPGNDRPFEVVGIPLRKTGFYVVELGQPDPWPGAARAQQARYVATAALVTNMAVHFKWGRGRSLAWVTTLDTGQPVCRRQCQHHR